MFNLTISTPSRSETIAFKSYFEALHLMAIVNSKPVLTRSGIVARLAARGGVNA